MRAFTLALLLLAASTARAQDNTLASHFDYDATAPLGLRQLSVEQRGAVAIHDIAYVSPKGGEVPAYLVQPAGKGPFAAVVWGHWYWDNSEFRNRREFVDEAVLLAKCGVVSLLTDGPVARPGHVPANTPMNEQQFTDLVQQVVDMRRGVDLLLQRGDVDPNRIGYVGHSYNASVGGFLSGLEKRFAAFVLMAGSLSDSLDLQSPQYRAYREKMGPDKWDPFVAAHRWADPGLYVAHAAPAAVFLQYATREDFLTADRAKLYYAIVSEPKRLEIYDAPHALDARARRDRIAFLAEQLGFTPPAAADIDAVPALPQPGDGN